MLEAGSVKSRPAALRGDLSPSAGRAPRCCCDCWVCSCCCCLRPLLGVARDGRIGGPESGVKRRGPSFELCAHGKQQ